MMLKKCLLETKVFKLLLVLGLLSTAIVLAIYYLTNDGSNSFASIEPTATYRSLGSSSIKIRSFSADGYKPSPQKKRFIEEKIKRLTGNSLNSESQQLNVPKSAKHSTRNVHLFYSIPVDWFKSNESNNSLEKSKSLREMRHLGSSVPNRSDPNTVFYPFLGLYSVDAKTLAHHFENIKNLGIGVVVVTWRPTFQKFLLLQLLDELQRHQLQLAIEIDNYFNRTVLSIFNDIEYFHSEIWNHEAFYRVYFAKKRRLMPMFYVRKVSSLPSTEWSQLLTPNGHHSLRRSMHDAVMVGHIT